MVDVTADERSSTAQRRVVSLRPYSQPGQDISTGPSFVQGVGTLVEQEPFLLIGPGPPARGPGVQHCDLGSSLRGGGRRGQSGQSGAYDYYLISHAHLTPAGVGL